ncbi:MAG TPA: nuclear transport factor 2 family protein [Steroidobacteraceae bacterium]
MTGKSDFRELTRALYQVVSAPPEQRDWDAIRHYYHPQARLVRTGLNPDGSPFVSVFTLDAYIENVRQVLEDVSFSEVEVAQESVVFGNVARLTSVYEYTRRTATQTVRGRGVNFFTLVHDAGEWRIMSIVWDNERPGLSLSPEVYSPRAAS